MTTHDAPVEEECSAEQFLPALKERLQALLRLGALVPAQATVDRGLEKRTYGLLGEEARGLEIFLDDHGAWSNRAFVSLIEYVATLRGFAIVGFTLHHILDRLGRQYPFCSAEFGRRFRAATIETRSFTDEVIRTLFHEIVLMAESYYKGDLPRPAPEDVMAVEPAVQFKLPADLEHLDPSDRRKHVVEIASKFLAHKKILEKQNVPPVFDDADTMRRHVRELGTEEECRFFETRVQNLLARYDTYIKGSPIESEDPDLAEIRGYVAVVRRVARVVTELIHFIERHDGASASEVPDTKILELVDLDQVLHHALNYGLCFIHAYLNEATPLIDKALEHYTRRQTVTLAVPPDIDLHIRPVSLIAKIVEHHKTPVNVTVGDTTCFAGSIVQVLMAIGASPEAREVCFEGDQRALEDIKKLFEHGLGEIGQGDLPDELSYLGS